MNSAFSGQGGLRKIEGGFSLRVKVTPRASCNEICGWTGDALKVRLAAPPVDGKANRALVEFLAETLDVPRSCISIRTGDTSRLKHVIIRGPCRSDSLPPFVS